MKPSFHLLLVLVIAVLSLAGHIALVWAGNLRGFHPSILVAIRDMVLFVPIILSLIWLVRVQKCRANLTLLTAAIFLMCFGQLAQYRLFSDPEYGARGEKRRDAREMKIQTILRTNIASGYDDVKKKYLFGSTEVPPAPDPVTSQIGFFDVLTSSNTLVPLISLAVMLGLFVLVKRDDVLHLLQKNAFLIGLVTVVPFLIIVVFFSRAGKFLGETTPWEPVKLLFLITYGGLLADHHIHMSRTRWGLPPWRFLLLLGVAALMPVVPFFFLSDFGQMLVFGGVYALLYLIAVRRWTQIVYAVVLVGLLFPMFYFGIGIPNRINLRFHLWLDTWQAPPPETFWWKPFSERIQREYEGRTITNQDAWFDQSAQIAQGLFGVSDGQLAGEGLGLGFPEVVPVSDSDFVYVALSEELGLVGGFLLLMGLCAFVIAGINVATAAPDMFSKLLAAGFTAFIGLQALVNIGGVIRLLPMTGITLPFVSHGGWSLITSFAMLGTLLALSHRNHQERTSPIIENPVAVRVE
ncbi:MAG: FtsW/RodA/SpoVE family cell cycle protein [Acidobacteria bacterium]|nr:FtsW/RodA/SpoVE family cell cycle protein [Acidobacteriota bacterium]